MKQKSSKRENKLLFKYFLVGTGGMIVVGLAHVLFKSDSSTGMLFLPWMLGGMLIIPAAYRQGLKDGQKTESPNQALQPAVKTPVDKVEVQGGVGFSQTFER